MAGAKPKLTLEMQENICKKIRAGCTKRHAALSSGICEETFYNWIEKGNKQKQGIYVEFFKAIKNAEAEAIASYEIELRKIAHEGNVAAIIFYLVNRTKSLPPEAKWENVHNVRQSLTGADGEPLKITINVGTKDEQENVRLLTEGERTE